MTTTTHQAARDEAVAIFTRRIDRITEIQAQDHHADSHVVRVGQHLYVPSRFGDDLTGIESATVFNSLFHAQAVALHVRNGNRERGQPVPLAQALQDEIEHLTEMRAHIEGIAA